MTKSQVEENLKFIQSAMDIVIDQGTIDEYMAKLSNLQSLHGLSAETVRYAKKHTLIKQGSLLPGLFKTGLNATAVRLQLESDMAEEISILLYAERINSGLVHCADECRTAISKLKEEYRNLP
jgi:hypothetical protein